MGWLREKFKNIESGIDATGERFEGVIKQIKQEELIRKEEKRKKYEEAKKRNWDDLNWFLKSLKVIVILTSCIVFWIIVGPPLWKLLCMLWEWAIGYQIVKQLLMRQ